MKKIICIGCLMLSTILIYSFNWSGATPSSEIVFPDGYRHWTHVKTAVNNPSFATHSGFHHIYANKNAIGGYQTGKFPDGSIIVFDVLESITQKSGDIIEGKRKLVDVMVKDALKYKETGGWGYAEFVYTDTAERKTIFPTNAQCFSCHASQTDRDYIFSSYRN